MKYNFQIQNNHNDTFYVESVEEYKSSETDIKDFTEVLKDEPVRNYITNEVLAKYNFESISDLAKDILNLCSKRWTDREELRFLVRNSSKQIVGMIGVDILADKKADLWYFKMSSSPSFMLEVAKKIVPILKEENIQSLVTSVKPDNSRSIHILKTLGFKEGLNEDEMEMKF